MKRVFQYGILGLVISIAVVAVFLFYHLGDENPDQNSSLLAQPTQATEKQVSAANKPILQKAPKPGMPDEADIKTVANTLKLARMFGVHEAQADSFWDKLKDAEEDAKEKNVDIQFYGKVVDQYGQPVEGAKISFSVITENESLISMSLQLGRENTPLTVSEKMEVYSDSNGLFQIGDIRGTSASIDAIEKTGYLFKSKQYFTYTKRHPDTLQQASAQQPAIFELWKQGEGQALVHAQASLQFKKDEHNASKTVHLVAYPNNPAFNVKGDFNVTVFNQGVGRKPVTNLPIRETYDWWVSIESVSGGIQATKDTWLYDAPEDGYKKSLRFEAKSGAPDWNSGVDGIKVYFKTHELYGSAQMRIGAYPDGSVIVSFEDALINPAGSRDLEYDPAKKIQLKYQ